MIIKALEFVPYLYVAHVKMFMRIFWVQTGSDMIVIRKDKMADRVLPLRYLPEYIVYSHCRRPIHCSAPSVRPDTLLFLYLTCTR